jgi:N-methylhydantoinase A
VLERVLADGSVLQSLDEVAVTRLAHELRALGVEAVAVAYLHSYRYPQHEQRTRELLSAATPELAVTISSEVAPELREYERTSTTLVNAYTLRLTERYLASVQGQLAGQGYDGDLLLMASNAGLASVAIARQFPVQLLESGPAGGAVAASRVAADLAHDALLAFDMGGTTAKMCLIQGGEPLITREFEADRRYRFKPGSGWPVRTPVVDLLEIGAGGGSIARVDPLGLLKVGPESAGAHPGPACYGFDGQHPTVTDADLVLGYLDPDHFLGGAMRLDVQAARRALGPLAAALRLEVEEVAWGIHQVVNDQMANAARQHTLERGLDASQVPVLAYGGAGPIHAGGMCQALGARHMIVPAGAGALSAGGFLAAAPVVDLVRSLPGAVEQLPWDDVNALLGALQREGEQRVRQVDPDGGLAVERWAEMRYVGQGYGVATPLPPGPLIAGRVPDLVAAFAREYERRYRRAGPPVGVEVTHWRVVTRGAGRPLPALARLAAEPAVDRERLAFVPGLGAFRPVPVFRRERLRAGEGGIGPALIEERESTAVVPAGARWAVVAQGAIAIDLVP